MFEMCGRVFETQLKTHMSKSAMVINLIPVGKIAKKTV